LKQDFSVLKLTKESEIERQRRELKLLSHTVKHLEEENETLYKTTNTQHGELGKMLERIKKLKAQKGRIANKSKHCKGCG